MNPPDWANWTITYLFQTVQNAVSQILITNSGFLANWSMGIFSSFSAIVFALGVMNEMGNQHHTILDLLWALKRLLGTILIFWCMLFYWNKPLPAVGVSVPKLMSGETQAIAKGVTEDATADLITQCQLLYANREQPSWTDTIGAWVSYIVGGLALLLLQALAAAVILFGLIMEAVMVALGPLFLPTAIIPKVDFLFWGWFKSWMQYSLYRVFSAVIIAVCVKIVTLGFGQASFMPIAAQIVALPYMLALNVLCIILVASIPVIVHHTVAGFSGSPVNFTAVVSAAIARKA